MNIDLAALPKDVKTLHRMIADLVGEQDRARAEAAAEIDRLRGILKTLQRMQFGRRSERLDPDQLRLGLEDVAVDLAEAEEVVAGKVDKPGEPTERSGQRLSLPDHLPREERVVDAGVDICSCCCGPLHLIGESVSEVLDHVPAQFRVIRIRRPKYGCRSCGTIHQAPAPERPIAKGLATPALLSHVLIKKYCDHVPLYRQSQIFARRGVTLNRSTLANWVTGATWWLAPIRDRIADHVMGAERVFADDTVLPVLDPGRGRTRTGRLWVYARDDRPWGGNDPPAVLYHYSPDRKAERPAAHLKTFSGILQVDGYPGFEPLAARNDIDLAACWAHTRRKFYDVHQATGSPIAVVVLNRIRDLYAIEGEIRGRTAASRQSVRDRRSRPIIDALKPWLERQLMLVPQRSGLAEATRYALARWPALCRFLDDGRIDLDTNTVERAIRPVTLGRKNHLFAGSDGGADRWATISTLITTAKLNDVEPQAWLTDILQRLTDGHPINRIDELLPWNWCPATV
ncbi:IS66 family transposase [Ruegeria pomeroyi]|nr:IS66 family transposase [Ruegeria pomeroyi]